MHRIIHIGLLLLLALSTSAQKLKILVQEKDSELPVALAYVNLYANNGQSPDSSVQTDDKGEAVVHSEKYPCTIEVTATGYETDVLMLTATPANHTISFKLHKRLNPLNEVVVTGLSQPMKIKNALSVYKVIPKAVIESKGAVTLNEALKNELNVQISDDQILGSSLRMQSMAGNKVKVLIDGMPVNGREDGNINLGQINMNNVERIEVIQGPMSVVYGTDALGGVVNVITKNKKSENIQAGAYYESVGKYNEDAAATFRINSRSYVTLGGGHNFFQGNQYTDTFLKYRSGAYYDSLVLHRRLYFKPKEQYIANLNYSYAAPSGFLLKLSSDYLKEKVTNRGEVQVWDPFLGCYAFDEYYKTTRSLSRLMTEGKLGKTGKWQTQVGYAIYYHRKDRVSKDLVTLQETPTTVPGDQDTTTFRDLTLRSNYINKFHKLDYTIGYDINTEFARSNKINARTKSIEDYAVYTNLSYPLVEKQLTAQAGIRASANSTYTPPVIPMLGLLYTPVEKLQLRASYTNGFRAPSLKEMYLSFVDQNHHIFGNTDLKAEKSNHMQVSASYQLFEKQSNYLQFIVTGYYNNIFDGIVLAQKSGDVYQYVNIIHQRNLIGTTTVDGQWNNFHYQMGYSYAYTFVEKGSYEAFFAMEGTMNLQYSWERPGLNFSVFYKYNGEQPFLQSQITGEAVYSGTQYAYSMCDASVSKKFWDKKLQVLAGVKNIFDIKAPKTIGVVATGAHSSADAGSFLPRSLFTSLRVSLD